MILYHYSKEPYNVLLTRRKQGLQGPEGVKVQGNYLDHISFFFDPAPVDILPDIFSQKPHPVWFKGNKLYEHVVQTSDLDERILFQVVESAQLVALLDKFVEKHNWVADNPALLRKWRVLEGKKQAEWGEVGASRKLLEKQIKLNKGGITAAYLIARHRADFMDNYNKYAATVPHVMLYPAGGEIKVFSTSVVTLGEPR